MFTICLKASLVESRGYVVQLRTSNDGWDQNPILGVYNVAKEAWLFELDTPRYLAGFQFKFFVAPNRWQADPNLELRAPSGPDDHADDVVQDGKVYTFVLSALALQDPPLTRPSVELGRVQQKLFPNNVDPSFEFDVIVIGSGMAGGTVADFASDQDLNVLVFEAGGVLFPTHIGNLPRQHEAPGSFAKHIWALWDEFQVRNYDEQQPNDYQGGQGFNLGGRSVFWGGFIPRMTSWELDLWSTSIKWYLEDSGYMAAEDFMGRSTGPRTQYNRQVHLALRKLFPDMHHVDAPVAIRQRFEGSNTLATGVFSTADILFDSHLSPSVSGRQGLEILLNHEVVKIDASAPMVRVVARNLMQDREIVFKARTVVLSAGCLESARLAKRSAFPDPLGLIGKGVSDHPIFYTHFSVPRESPFFDPYGNVKTLSQLKSADPGMNALYNMLLELGTDLNHGRYIDEDVWLEHLRARKDKMLCEVVFLCNERLNEENEITFSDDGQFRPRVSIRKFTRPDLQQQTDNLKWDLLKLLGAQPTTGSPIDFRFEEERWKRAFTERGDAGEGGPGGVAHEVGSLRMRVTDKDGNVREQGLVDENLLYMNMPHDNVYVCDMSVFPTTPAANPSLTAVALAIRLANHLSQKLKPHDLPEELRPTVDYEIQQVSAAFARRWEIEVTDEAQTLIGEFLSRTKERDPGHAAYVLRELATFLESAANVENQDNADLARRSVLKMGQKGRATTPVIDAPQVRELIKQMDATFIS